MKYKALAMAVITTLLWSGSYILNKLAFQEGIGPLTLSGLRYLLAALLLLCLRRKNAPHQRKPLPFRTVLLLGVAGYAVAQGLQYVGQSYLTPTQSSLCLSVGNTAFVMLFDRFRLRENQSRGDLLKLLLLVSGISLYYYPFGSGGFSAAGLAFMAVSSVGYAVQLSLNRQLLAGKRADTRALVALPMLTGALILLVAGLLTEGLPIITGKLLLILLYLSGVSGALGFSLWTASQRELTAFESSSVNNLMLVEIALMDFFFFGRAFSALQIVAIAVVFAAILLIQSRKPRKPVGNGAEA